MDCKHEPHGELQNKRRFWPLVSRTWNLHMRVALALVCALVFSLPLTACSNDSGSQAAFNSVEVSAAEAGPLLSVEGFDMATVPQYEGELTVELNGGAPYFDDTDAPEGLEAFSPLDELGRCDTAVAVVGKETMPTEERGSIQEVRPSGWHSEQYDWVDGESLYNRSHLIAYQLTGQNANELNLITGTRSMNSQGMLPYEESIADYVRTTGNHVLYRVTPVFEGDNLVASGVLMEARSVEDDGWGLEFCVWCYNVEPGVAIDYKTGDSWPDNTSNFAAVSANGEDENNENAAAHGSTQGALQTGAPEAVADISQCSYVLNTSTNRFHLPNCSSVVDIKESNRKAFSGTREEVVALGYEPCGTCKP
ncbi:DNA/RNA non-specific endonuclease [Adlercreutzia sp. ZJ138]|uniref:DNA/RNA non-specific endonuclease n=1 Tax=Adlercreutzia sp. ZJ138 TaxID=2709405 RepID=UPI001F152DC7|nr:DNA/RNA non-specific endonuclease [Adlercreutzia sp. ZJ138]